MSQHTGRAVGTGICNLRSSQDCFKSKYNQIALFCCHDSVAICKSIFIYCMCPKFRSHHYVPAFPSSYVIMREKVVIVVFQPSPQKEAAKNAQAMHANSKFLRSRIKTLLSLQERQKVTANPAQNLSELRAHPYTIPLITPRLSPTVPLCARCRTRRRKRCGHKSTTSTA